MKLIYIILGISALLTSCSTEESTQNDTEIKVTTEHLIEKEETPLVDNSPKPGEFLEKYPNGFLKTDGWFDKDMNRDRSWTSYYESGTKWSVSNYKNGIREGESIVYFPNGNVRYSGFYTNDEKSGHWKFYTEAGELDKEEDY